MEITTINGKITVNGKSYKGNNVVVRKNEIYVDGKLVGTANEEKTINVTIEGNCNSVTNEVGDIVVKGNVLGNVKGGTGDIQCGDVTGNVTGSVGDINCGNIGGDANTNVGDINKE